MIGCGSLAAEYQPNGHFQCRIHRSKAPQNRNRKISVCRTGYHFVPMVKGILMQRLHRVPRSSPVSGCIERCRSNHISNNGYLLQNVISNDNNHASLNVEHIIVSSERECAVKGGRSAHMANTRCEIWQRAMITFRFPSD